MTPQTVIQVDAFTSHPFRGNPAAVCVMDAPRPEAWMQAVAAEMNLSETAFLTPEAGDYRLRWFTPTVEVDLCGHATLASAHVLWTEGHLPTENQARFHTRSGLLTAERRDGWIELDFPATPAAAVAEAELVAALADALGVTPLWVGRSQFDLLVEVATTEQVQTIAPDFARLALLDARGIIVTSPGGAEVEQGDVRLVLGRRDHDVLGLDVAVHDACVVDDGEGLGHGRADLADESFADTARLGQQVAERLALDVLEQDVGKLLALDLGHAGRQRLHDALVLHALARLDLAEEAGQEAAALQEVGVDDLERAALAGGVRHLVDPTHASATELALDGVRPDRRGHVVAPGRGLLARPGRGALEALHHGEHGEQVGDALGQVRVLRGVVLGRHRLAGPQPADVVLGQLVDQLGFVLGHGRHGSRGADRSQGPTQGGCRMLAGWRASAPRTWT